MVGGRLMLLTVHVKLTLEVAPPGAASVTVTAAPTTTVLSPLTTAPYGQNITFTATVSAAAPRPTGMLI